MENQIEGDSKMENLDAIYPGFLGTGLRVRLVLGVLGLELAPAASCISN